MNDQWIYVRGKENKRREEMKGTGILLSVILTIRANNSTQWLDLTCPYQSFQSNSAKRFRDIRFGTLLLSHREIDFAPKAASREQHWRRGVGAGSSRTNYYRRTHR